MPTNEDTKAMFQEAMLNIRSAEQESIQDRAFAQIFSNPPPDIHPLQIAFNAAIRQATQGKETKHGGNTTPFYEQKWRRLADAYGTHGLLYQACKKAEESQSKATAEESERELLGAIVYLGMAYLKMRGYP